MEVLKQLHISVSQNFDKLFDEAYKSLHTELTRRDEYVKELDKKLAGTDRNTVSAEVLKLNREISLLREEIRRNDVGLEDIEGLEKLVRLKDVYSPEHLLWVFETGDQEDGRFTADKMKAVWDQYLALYKDFQTLIDASKDLKAKIKRHKRKLQYWGAHLDKEEFTLVLGGRAVKFKRVPENTRDDMTRTPSKYSPLCPTDLPVKVGDASAQIHLTPTSDLTASRHNAQGNGGLPPAASMEPLSTQSEKSKAGALKRKRDTVTDHASSKRGLHGTRANDQLAQPVLIKGESMSSSPIRIHLGHNVAGTQDLDEVGSAVETPRKRKSYHLDGQSHELPSDTTKSPLPRNPTALRLNRHKTEPTQLAPKRPTVLQPVDTNLPSANGPRIWSEQKQSNKSERRSRYALDSVAEDGDESLRLVPRRGQVKQASRVQLTQTSTSMDDVLIHQRLDDLLERPLRPRHPLHIQKKNRNIAEIGPDQRDISRDPCTQASGRVKEPSESSEPTESAIGRPSISVGDREKSEASPQEGSRSHSFKVPDTVAVHSEDEPFRARPLHRLGLRHFKINPNANQGLDFAYDTVVRRKDERKCVSGCTRPGCCREKFHAMARLGGPPTTTDGSDDGEEEQKMLEDYLGEEKHLLDQLSAEERQSLLHEARARRMANLFSKHRHDHQRPSTPPGFWRTDMPDTQELEHDREVANNLEREKVKERYREAMRGGMWKFADE
ncbi:SAE2 C-terminal domain-containing protein [Aspergillus novofumigatus IBT 16806]|uniref:SAE2-domain-containing protein n=1 Tax=Aspergillus novofumigatus (strain IBT 16806) TaxID=1392255 RepID=A0A2I1CA66_ASPN1|nr:SAE2-domain-containing protein [Aspergillus novofumigatus IBT 16806]PKX94515.1 SAE2-domain-containing protein [Aspergillus novofumigatus IBT 16806]